MRPWFEEKPCTALEIRKYQSISDPRVVASVCFEDAAAISRLVARIETLPVDGDQMKSFAETAEHIELLFSFGTKVQKIGVFSQRFQTPSTGFNPRSELETELYADVDALLFPEVGKVVLKVERLPLRFGDFVVTYQGRKVLDGGPTTVTGGTDSFLVADTAGAEQVLQVFSGQRSPQPLAFKVGRRKLTLLTYQTKAGKRLFADHFQIVP